MEQTTAYDPDLTLNQENSLRYSLHKERWFIWAVSAEFHSQPTILQWKILSQGGVAGRQIFKIIEE